MILPTDLSNLKPDTTPGGVVYRVTGSGPPLVMLHGSAGSWRHWAANIGALGRVRTLFLPDLPGYGDSPDVTPGISVDVYLDIVEQAVVEMCGDRMPIDMVGFSFGGQIAAGCASRLGKKVRKLTLLTPSGFERPEGRVIGPPRESDFGPSAEERREFHRRMLLAVMFANASSADDAAIEIQAHNFSRSRFNGRHVSQSGRLMSFLRQIESPIQLIYGDGDVVAYPSPEERIRLCLAAQPAIRSAIVAGAGHWLQYERADEVNRLILDFQQQP